MAFELKQQLALKQQLVMTPQLQQAIKLLQLNHLELADLVSQEMVENPMLEERVEERVDPLAERAASDARPETADPNSEGQLEGGDFDPLASVTPPESSSDEGPAQKDDIDWEKYLEAQRSAPSSGGEIRRDGDDLPTYDQTLTRSESLSEHLMWQLHMEEAEPAHLAAAASIVGNLDHRGFLQEPLEELADREMLSYEDAEEGLAIVQSLDPLGVGARNLPECLLIQARALHEKDRILIGMLRDHPQAFMKQDYKTIARALGVSLQRVVDSVKLVATFETRPGREFSDEEPRYITPDIYIVKSNGEYIIQLNEEGVPKLRVSNYYRRVLSGADKKDKEYITEKLRSAQWLIRSIYQRQRTIYKVTESILKQQREFFEEGIAKLKPMILRDVAEDIGMHESTVSRVTSNKYVDTPHGIFSLKFFFNSGIQRGDGDDVASEMVKQRIKAIVDDENPRKPFSDQKIVTMLKTENIVIARRTVAKYRDMLNIPSSSQRKRLF